MKPTKPRATGDSRDGTGDAANRPDDDAKQREILEAVGSTPSHLGTLLYNYYRDKARADRTSRELLYLHLGIAAGALKRTNAQEGAEEETAERQTPDR